ncbi:MAG TPA: hypothetical protein DEV81_02650 [Cyanobacteria bacterium UBA11049]|nr:hypothetical protein [Cyanobacteria bacterium UBA11049]
MEIYPQVLKSCTYLINWYSLIKAALKEQMVHNAEVKNVDTNAISALELWSFVEKNIHFCLPEELVAGDCWIALS